MLYERIRGLRESHNYTQRKLSELLHVSQATYSRYESGALDIPIQALADLYEVSVDYILGRSES